MRLLIFGRSGSVSDGLVERMVREMMPDYLVVLMRSGLSVVASEVAKRAGIDIVRYWPDFIANGKRAMEMAIRQMTANEGPITCICLRPRPTDYVIIEQLVRFGHDVVVGKLDTSSRVEWLRVPANKPTEDLV